MNDQSKLIEKYRTWMVVFMILIGLGGCVLAYTSSRVYNSYYFTTGGYYTTNWTIAISYLVSTGVTILLLRAICNVTCECFNNVYIIRKSLENNKQERRATEAEGNIATENAPAENTVNNAVTMEDKSKADNHTAEMNATAEDNSRQ